MTCSTQTPFVAMIRRFEEMKQAGETNQSYRCFHAFLVARGYGLSESALIKHVYQCVRPYAEDT